MKLASVPFLSHGWTRQGICLCFSQWLDLLTKREWYKLYALCSRWLHVYTIKKKTIAEQANTIVQLCLDTKITPGGQGGWVWGLGVVYSGTFMGYTVIWYLKGNGFRAA